QGGILYKSTTRIALPLTPRDETDVAKLFKDVPATYADASIKEGEADPFATASPAGVQAAAPAAGAAAGGAEYAPRQPTAEQEKQADKQMDAMITGLGAVPDECKRYARLVCRHYQGPPEYRVQACKAQVDGVRKLAGSPQGKGVCTNMLKQYEAA